MTRDPHKLGELQLPIRNPMRDVVWSCDDAGYVHEPGGNRGQGGPSSPHTGRYLGSNYESSEDGQR